MTAMKRQGKGGGIINVTSIAARRKQVARFICFFQRFYFNHDSRVCKINQDKIRVNAVSPGVMLLLFTMECKRF